MASRHPRIRYLHAVLHGFFAADTGCHTFAVQSYAALAALRGRSDFMWRKLMHKHRQNLERLYQKLQFRYGQDDELVMQVKHEIESNETRYSRSRPEGNQGPRLQDNAESSHSLH